MWAMRLWQVMDLMGMTRGRVSEIFRELHLLFWQVCLMIVNNICQLLYTRLTELQWTTFSTNLEISNKCQMLDRLFGRDTECQMTALPICTILHMTYPISFGTFKLFLTSLLLVEGMICLSIWMMCYGALILSAQRSLGMSSEPVNKTINLSLLRKNKRQTKKSMAGSDHA